VPAGDDEIVKRVVVVVVAFGCRFSQDLSFFWQDWHSHRPAFPIYQGFRINRRSNSNHYYYIGGRPTANRQNSPGMMAAVHGICNDDDARRDFIIFGSIRKQTSRETNQKSNTIVWNNEPSKLLSYSIPSLSVRSKLLLTLSFWYDPPRRPVMTVSSTLDERHPSTNDTPSPRIIDLDDDDDDTINLSSHNQPTAPS
jgi:hypothetical protein